MRSIVFLPLALLPFLATAGCQKSATEHKPEIMVVSTQRVEAEGNSTLSNSAPESIATVRAHEETDFSFKVGGMVELIGPEPRRDWDEGSTVEKGTVLARLHVSARRRRRGWHILEIHHALIHGHS